MIKQITPEVMGRCVATALDRVYALPAGEPDGSTPGSKDAWLYGTGYRAMQERYSTETAEAWLTEVNAQLASRATAEREAAERQAKREAEQAKQEKLTHWLPTIPYSLIDAINRSWLATGSMRNAALGADANYNGHSVSVSFNDYRKYWIAEYFWAGREVLCRGSLEECLRAAKTEYAGGARGTQVIARPRNEEEAAIVAATGFSPYSKEIEAAHMATFQDERFNEIHGAMSHEKWFGVPAVGYLANSKTVEEYRAKVDACFAERKPKPLAYKEPKLEEVW